MPGKSKDVVQQKIRDDKSSWNHDVSHFISKMIAFKRGINGRGDTKYNLPISKIQDSFVASIPQTLSQLTAEYEKLSKTIFPKFRVRLPGCILLETKCLTLTESFFPGQMPDLGPLSNG